MYCTCSNKNNYEIISLCDIKKFTDKNGPFNNKPWVQISVADILMLDCNKLAIEKIEKIYIDVSITNTKIIETPISPAPNSEGMTLTGKKLLIDGFICSKIVYTSLSKEQSVYTSNFIVPFCTYIVLEANADLFNDKYCIKTCIEDVFLSLKDCKTIFQNVTLFLFAEKVSITCPNPQLPKDNCWIISIPQQIEFINVSKIDFNTDDNKNLKLIVTSLGNMPNRNLDNTAFYLFKIRDISNNIKFHSLIKANEDASNFVNTLNNINFQLDDVIELDAFESNKIKINNFPQLAQEEFVNSKIFNMESYKKFLKITGVGIENYNPPILLPTSTLPNTIKINKINNSPLISLNFNTLDKLIQVFSFDSNADSIQSYNYIIIKLLDSNNNVVSTATLPSNGSSSDFINNIMFKTFHYGYFLDLTYDDKSKSHITITNLQGGDHTPTNNKERFKITAEGLEPINLFLPNTININNISNSPVTSIKFNILTKKFNILPLTTLPDSSGEYNYLVIKLYNERDSLLTTPITTATLVSNINSSAFSDILNKSSFEYNYIMKLTYSSKAMPHILITNFPIQGQNHTSQNTTEYYKITPNGLVIYRPSITATSTAFIFKTLDTDSEMTMLDFNTTNKKLVVTSTGKPYNSGNVDAVFTFTLKGSDGSVKKSASIKGIENGDNFRNALNDIDFNFGDIVEVTFENSSKINLINYPNKDDTYTMPLNSKNSSFIITKEGLVCSFLSKTSINFKSYPDDIQANLKFNTVEKKFLVYSTGNVIFDRSIDKFFSLKLKDSNGNLKEQVSMNLNENANNFRDIFNNLSFEYNDIITIDCEYNLFDKFRFSNIDKISISDYKEGTEYILFLQNDSFRITKNGLETIHNYINSRMTFIGFFQSIVINIRFNSDSKTFSVGTFSKKVDDAHFNGVECFRLTLKKPNGTVKLEKSINGDEVATNFSVGLNNLDFEYNDILTIRCLDITKHFISDYINYNNIKFPSSIETDYKITENGLVDPYTYLNNEISVISGGNDLIIKLRFNIDLKTLSVGNTLIVNRYTEDKEYFALILKDSNGNVKTEASILGENYASKFSTTLNKQSFEYDDIITLRYVQGSIVSISNYPNTGNKYNPTSKTQSFKITDKGLILI